MSDKPAMDNPYVGPRPFTTQERELFFGREHEARSLVSLVVSEKLVLFYAQSGAGKSSLINTRLIPGLAERGYAVLPVGRVSGQAAAEAAVDNIFTYHLLLNLQQMGMPASGAGGSERLAHLTLAQYLASLPTEEAADNDGQAQSAVEPADVMVPLVEGGYQPLALIIDQFEEIFTTHLEAWQQREPFFRQLCEAMEADPHLWIILTIREDYVASLDPYIRYLPGIGKARFYMQRMGYPAALQAVRRPVAGICPFAPGVAEELVDNLRLIYMEEGPEGKSQYVTGEFIEPVQLQVVCYQLWEQLKKQPGGSITGQDLKHLARGGDLAHFVSRALGDFYEQAIQSVLRDLRGMNIPVSERALRDWFSKALITEAQTRGFVFQGEENTGGLPNPAVALLERQFIIRSETRAAGKWYELVHDRFVVPILEANNEWNLKNPRPALADTEAWIASGRSRAKLYDGRQLKEALERLENRPDTLADLDREFIHASQAAASQQQARFQRRLTLIFILAAVVFIFLGVFSYLQARAASEQSRIAGEKEKEAVMQKSAAQVASTWAVQQQQTAQAAAVEAVFRRDLAATAQAGVEAKSRDAFAIKLALESPDPKYTVNEEVLKKSLLLSVAAYRLSPNRFTLPTLFQNLAVFNEKTTAIAGEYFDPISSELSKKIGKYLQEEAQQILFDFQYSSYESSSAIIVTKSGMLKLLNMSSGEEMNLPEPISKEQDIKFIAITEAGAPYGQGYIYTIGAGGSVKIWNAGDLKLQDEFPLPEGMQPACMAAVHPLDMAQIAVGAEDGKVMVWDSNARLWKEVDKQDRPIESLAWYPYSYYSEESFLAIGGQNGSVKFVNPSNGARREMPRVHHTPIRAMLWISDPSSDYILISGSEEGLLARWNTQTGEYIQAKAEPVKGFSNGSVAQVYFAVISAKPGAPVKLYDTTTLQEKWTMSVKEGVQTVISEWSQAFTINPNGQIAIWNPINKTQLTRPLNRVTSKKIAGIAVDQPGNILLLENISEKTAKTEQTLQVIDMTGKRLGDSILVKNVGEKDLFYEIGYRGKQLLLAVGWADGSIEIRDALTGRTLLQKFLPSRQITALAFLPDGAGLAVAACLIENAGSAEDACGKSEIKLIDTQTGQAGSAPEWMANIAGKVGSIAFRQDGNELIFYSDKGIYFGERNPGEGAVPYTPELIMPAYLSGVERIAFDPDSGLVAVAGYGEVGFWESGENIEIGSLNTTNPVHTTGLRFIRDTAGQKKLLLMQVDGVPVEIDFDPEVWAEKACAAAGRDLTAAERDQDLPPGSQDLKVCP